MDGGSYYMGRGRQSVYSLLTALCLSYHTVNGESLLFVTKQSEWWISWSRPQMLQLKQI